MTKDNTWELLEYTVTTFLANRHPELDRQTLRLNVSAALEILRRGLRTVYVCGLTGELTEVTNVYEVRVP